MKPISAIPSGTVQSAAAATGTKEPSKAHRSEDKNQKNSLKPVMDEYIPEEQQEPSGRYWMEKDENGKPKIYFDDPERAANHPTKPEDEPKTNAPDTTPKTENPDKNEKGRKAEACRASTDKVDREIKKLKEKKKMLEQKLNTENDGEKIEELEKEWSKVENELRQKDNDAYRRQHTEFS